MNLIIEEAICSQTLQTIYKFGKRQKVVQGLTNILTIELCGYQGNIISQLAPAKPLYSTKKPTQ